MITALTLTPDDAKRARVVALARMGAALAVGRTPAYGAGRAALALHIDGARAELAFARMIGADLTDWADFVNLDLASITGDVAGWEVRSTRYRAGRLIIHPRDNPARRFALVVTNGVTYRAAGWILAADARRAEWWQTLNPAQSAAWCVPQDALLPF